MWGTELVGQCGPVPYPEDKRGSDVFPKAEKCMAAESFQGKAGDEFWKFSFTER